MNATRTMLIGSIVWAVVFMLSAYVFRGRPVGTYIQGVLYVVWTMCFSYWAVRLPNRSCR
jgi:ABC-type multidrug transport system permease subunit